MKSLKLFLLTSLFLLCFQPTIVAQPEVGDLFPGWSAGHLDIHHINTGRGESVFAILPDGTTMLIDAGDEKPSLRSVEAKPDSSRTPGEWITRYVLHMMCPLPEKKLDYIYLTHFHEDHMGDVSASRKRSAKGDYMLTGITEVGDNIPFGKIIDRNWPDYNWPTPMADNPNIQNYIRFVNWHVANSGCKAGQFLVGSNQQFKLLRQPDKYPEFEIRNIVANGQVWTGVHNNVRNHFPPVEMISEQEFPDENQCCSGIRITYGKFDYFNGGDIGNASAHGTWQDIETPVGLVLGPVDVCEANHHAAFDAMGIPFLNAVSPKVTIVQALGAGHPDKIFIHRMIELGFPEDRDVFSTNLMEATRLVIGSRRTGYMKSTQGHIVVRVYPGGDNYQVIVLDDSAESFTIKSIHGPYESR